MICCGWTPWAPSILYASIYGGGGQAFLKTNKPKGWGNRLRVGLVSLVSLTVCHPSLPIFPYSMVSVEEDSVQQSPRESPED